MGKGIIASPGVAIAKALILKPVEINIDDAAIGENEKETEIQKFKDAVEKAETQLNDIIAITEERLSANEADVFRAHLMMLYDPMLEESVQEKINAESKNAAKAISEATEEISSMMANLEDEYMRERAADIKDVGGRVLENILGITRVSLDNLSEETIVIANDLTPSDTATMDMDYVKGFITEIGGRTSHTSIIARIMGLPAIVGTGDILQRVKEDDIVVLDGIDADIVINPTDEQRKVYEEKQEKYLERKRELDKDKMLPAITTDGHQVEVVGNIAAPRDGVGALEQGAEGVGLFRTEFLYMQPNLPSEEEQYAVYKELADLMGEKPVVIRTLDIGGDKEAESIQFPEEMNPFLGWRAVRMYFDRADIIKPQLRAILRASVGANFHIMYPMIISAEEIYGMKEIMDECKQELKNEGVAFDEDIKVGIMVETPAAAFEAEKFAQLVDFFSIGTNDMTQYVLAVDRGNEMIANLYQPLSPAVLRSIKMVIDASHKHGKWTGVCGELAGDEMGAALLLGMGLDEFSMSAGSIPAIKNLIRKSSYAEAQKLVEECLELYTVKEIEEKVQAFIDKALA